MKAARNPAMMMGAIGIAVSIPHAIAQTTQDAPTEHRQPGGPGGLSPFVRDIRRATQGFQDPNAAIAAGYVAMPDCVSGPNQGAMGVHFVNETYIADGEVDVKRPDVLVYEPANGGLRLAAIEFFVPAEQWDAANAGPPVLGGQLFHYVGAPNRLRSPAYYELHVWAWKRNPNGVFADWNPTVSCASYTGPSGGEGAGSGGSHGH